MYISTKSLTAAAALSAGVAADFLVITEYPDALQTMSPEQVLLLPYPLALFFKVY
jgi:hypothetical protein